MPVFIATYFFIDDRDGITSKQWQGEFVDYATAATAATNLSIDLTAATSAAIYKYTLAEVVELANSPSVGARVTDRMSATVYLDQSANKKANFQLPAPAPAILSGNSLLQSTAWHDVTDNFTSAGGWQVSDGEHIDKPGGATDGTVTGKLVSVRSGIRSLPV